MTDSSIGREGLFRFMVQKNAAHNGSQHVVRKAT